jgi:hypothetical protein
MDIVMKSRYIWKTVSRPVWIVMAFAFFGLASCAEDTLVNYEPLYQPKLVVQSRLSPDTTFQVSVVSNKKPTENGEYEVPSDLKVSLIRESGSVVNLYLENGVYVAPQSYPVAGESYSLFVTPPPGSGYAGVESITSIPRPVTLAAGEVMDLRLEESVETPDKMNVVYDLKLTLSQSNHRYFHLAFIQTTTINVGTSSDPEFEERAYYIEPQFPVENGFYPPQETGVMVDVEKTGMEDELRFSFVDYTLSGIEELGNLFIEFRTVTPEYYNYFTSLSRQLISREDPFAEPIPVYNNIQDGSGNFSGFSRLVYTSPIIP